MASSSSAGRGVIVAGVNITNVRPKPMKRPGTGRLGTPILLRANFFRLSAPRLHEVYQYCLFVDAMRKSESGGQELTEITPAAPIHFLRNVLASWWAKHVPNVQYAHDGRKTIYTPAEIQSSLECESDEPGDTRFGLEVDDEGNVVNPGGRTETVYVRVRIVSTIDCRKLFSNKPMDVHEASQVTAAIDTVLAASPVKTHVPVGRSFYHPHGAAKLGEGAEAWRGFYQSARRSVSGVLLNMDESRSPFWATGTNKYLFELIQEMGLRVRPNDDRGNRKVAKILNGLKVQNTETKIAYRVHGFSRKSAFEESFFDAEVNSTVTVAEYVRRKYGVALQDRNGLCVKTSPKKNTLVPLELLVVKTKQRLTRAMTPKQTQDMIRVAATKPHIRQDGAVQAIKRVNHNSDPVCKSFGITVDQKIMQLRGRVLPPPVVLYEGRTIERPSQGVWNNRHSKKLRYTIPIINWCVLNLTRKTERAITEFTKNLAENAGKVGIQMNNSPRVFQPRRANVEEGMNRIGEEYAGGKNRVNGVPLQLILIVKFGQDSADYSIIKSIGDLKMGVATQVMLEKHLQPRQQTYYGNLLLKINAKLGGINFQPVAPHPQVEVPFARRRHIILGADVSHPASGMPRPSVAAVVGSRNVTLRNGRYEENSQFTGSLRNLPPRQEMITEMGSMFREVYDRWLNSYPTNDRQHASSIIMYRDGVSEGQFEDVMKTEIEGIRRACAEYHKQWNPKITYIIVTKRHHARFFPCNKQDADRSGNCPPGTVIDTDVVSSEFYDFYLNSHAGIQGTSRPSKYTVLIDENNIPVDALQAYCYRMAHGYARCSRSVSMVNSSYYAHLLAFRGRAYMNEDGSDTASVVSLDSNVPVSPPLHEKLGKRLFFV